MKVKKTVSDKVIAANRENAQKSTGPQTMAAKAAVKHNAVKHGLVMRSLLFEDDDEKAEFSDLAAKLEDDLKPQGIMQEMLVEDIATSWWKVQMAQRLLLGQLSTRHLAPTSILHTFINASRGVGDVFSSRLDDLHNATHYGLEGRELVLRVDDNKSEGKGTTAYGQNTEKTQHVVLEARLGNPSESLLRYEISWRRDLYRAIETLNHLQMAGGSLTLPGRKKGNSTKQSH